MKEDFKKCYGSFEVMMLGILSFVVFFVPFSGDVFLSGMSVKEALRNAILIPPFWGIALLYARHKVLKVMGVLSLVGLAAWPMYLWYEWYTAPLPF